MERSAQLAAAIAALAVAGALIGLRAHGVLQPLDLTLYDAYRSSARSDISQRVALVLVTEDDIRWLGDWPMHDQELALVRPEG